MKNIRMQVLTYLLDEYLSTHSQQQIEIPQTEEEQDLLIRALMNVRAPSVLDPDFLNLQDIYLQYRQDESEITDCDVLTACNNDPQLYLWQGDITKLKVDGIVNAANSQMLGCFHPNHGCIDNAIHSAAGLQLRDACYKIMQQQGHEEETGEAKITAGFNLPAKYVLHTVGPIINSQVTEEQKRQLAYCYRSVMQLADNNHLASIAFCCISTGEFRFPPQLAAEIAVHTVRETMPEMKHINKVIFNVFKDQDLAIYQEVLNG